MTGTLRVRGTSTPYVRRDDRGRVVLASADQTPGQEPWVRLDPLIDVLRKLPDGRSDAPYDWVDLREHPWGPGAPGPWTHALDVPLDWEWARDRVVLPGDVLWDPPPAGGGSGRVRTTTDLCTITSAWDPEGDTWRRSSWRQGEPYDGPRPAPRPRWWSS